MEVNNSNYKLQYCLLTENFTMRLERYDYTTDHAFENFTFNSIGPKGLIRKIVSFQGVSVLPDGQPVINLALGDWDELVSTADDRSISNNKDREKILATVAHTVLEYTDVHGQRAVYAKGSTPARTRLYQMSINAHLHEIEKLFDVFGQLNGQFFKFEKGVNYEAFLVLRK